MRYDIIGAGGGGKGGGGGGGITEDPDNLSSVAVARVVDLISEGECWGLVNAEYSIYFDGVPLRDTVGTPNYKPFSWDVRVGTQTQDVMPGFAGVQQETAVGLKISVSEGPITRAITDPDADAVRVTVAVPALSQTENDGHIHGTSVKYTVRVRVAGGSWVTAKNDTISGKTGSRYQRSYEVALATLGPGPYEVQVERVTPDSTSSLLINDLYWDSYTVINYEQLTYPNSCLVGTQLDARYFSQIPQRTYHWRGLLVRVPANCVDSDGLYDRSYRTTGPGTTMGGWDGTFVWAWTDNPAWCFYDLILSKRYGLGRRINASQIDKWTLYEIAKYCDEYVPTDTYDNVFERTSNTGFNSNGEYRTPVPMMAQDVEPRFTLNCVLNTAEDAYKVINQLTSVFRGMSYWASAQVALTQDRPGEPEMLFTNANVENGLFNYQGSSRAQRHTVIIVGWNDPSENFTQRYEYVEDREGIARYGIRSTTVLAFGCTSRSQARRVGLWTLYTERLETEAITFTASLDSVNLMPGKLIQIADNNRAGARLGGRIFGIQTNLFPYSDQMAAWTNYANPGCSTVDGVATSGPGQPPTMSQLKESSTNQQQIFDRYEQYKFGPGQYVINVVVTPNGRSRVLLGLYSATQFAQGLFDLSAGTFSLGGNRPRFAGMTLVDSSTNTYLCTVIVNFTDVTAPIQRIQILDATDTGSGHLGDGSSGLLVAHKELLFNPTYDVYTPTQGTQASTLRLDSVQTVLGETYDFSVIDQSGQVQNATFTGTGDSSNMVTVSPAIYPQPTTLAIWTMSTTTVKDLLARVVSIKDEGNDKYLITALVHNPSKFDAVDYGVGAVKQNYSFLTFNSVAPVTGLKLKDSSYRPTTASDVSSILDISWDSANDPLVRGFIVKVSSLTGVSQTYDEQTDITKRIEGLPAATYTVSVFAVNQFGIKSLATTGTIIISGIDSSPPDDVTGLTYSIEQSGPRLKWSTLAEPDIDYYEVRVGGTRWDDATFLAQAKASSIPWTIQTSGTWPVWVKAVDTSGNKSINAASMTVVISGPSQPVVTARVQQNFVELKWNDCTTTQPMKQYTISNGATFSTSTFVGSVTGLFKTIFESAAGTYRFWVVAEDIAGNKSVPSFVDVVLTQPPDYSLIGDHQLALDQTGTNIFRGEGTLYMLINSTQTVADRFTSYTTIQGKDAAGDVYVFEPGTASASYEEVVDLLSAVPPSTINVTPSARFIGSPTLTVTLSGKANLSDPWTNYPAGQSTVTVTGIRYVKVHIDAAGVGGDLVMLDAVHVIVGATKETHTVEVSITDTTTANGQRFEYSALTPGITWFDIIGIQATPAGTGARSCTYVRDADPLPSGLWVGLWNDTGGRVTGNVSLTITGVRSV